MPKADLSYHIKAGDEFKEEVAELQQDQQTQIVVRRATMGSHTNEPHKSQDLLKWLAQRGMDFLAFRRWQNDSLAKKVYFPLLSEVLEGRLVRLLADKGNVLGGLVKLQEQDAPPGEDAGSGGGELVVFEKDDFYAHEVWAGCVDLRILLRPGDVVSVMVSDLGGRKMAALRGKLSAEEQGGNVRTASLAFVGERRPRNANLKPGESPPLKGFLERVGMSVEEMEQSYAEQEGGGSAAVAGDTKPQQQQQQQQQAGILGPAPPMWPVVVNPMFTPGLVAPIASKSVTTGGGGGMGELPPALLAQPGINLTSRAIKLQSAEDPKVREVISDSGKEQLVWLWTRF